MREPLFVFCADLQARESAYRSIKELKGDDLYALRQVVDYCKQHRLPLVLGGDQVDMPTISDEHTIELRKILVDVPHQNTYYVDGNHEKGFKRLCMEGGNAAVARNLEESKGYVTFAGFVAGYNWRTRRQWDAYLKANELQKADVLILHGFASQVIPALGLPPDETPLCDMDLEWFDGKYKLVLMGDIHIEWEWQGPKGTRFLYSGSMWMHRLGEPETKSFIVVYSDLSVERIPLRCRPFFRTEINSEEDLKKIEIWLDACDKLTYVSEMCAFMGDKLPRLHIKIPSNMSSKLAAGIESLKQRAFVFEKVDISHDRDLSEVKGSLEEKVDIDSALNKLLNPKTEIDQEVMAFIQQAMNAGFDEAVNALKKKVGI
jgi:hypothetical protein